MGSVEKAIRLPASPPGVNCDRDVKHGRDPPDAKQADGLEAPELEIRHERLAHTGPLRHVCLAVALALTDRAEEPADTTIIHARRAWHEPIGGRSTRARRRVYSRSPPSLPACSQQRDVAAYRLEPCSVLSRTLREGCRAWRWALRLLHKACRREANYPGSVRGVSPPPALREKTRSGRAPP